MLLDFPAAEGLPFRLASRVPPFLDPEGTKVYLDESLKRGWMWASSLKHKKPPLCRKKHGGDCF